MHTELPMIEHLCKVPFYKPCQPPIATIIKLFNLIKQQEITRDLMSTNIIVMASKLKILMDQLENVSAVG